MGGIGHHSNVDGGHDRRWCLAVGTGKPAHLSAHFFACPFANSDAGVVGYELTSLVCVEGNNPLSQPSLTNPQVALALGENVVCTLTNTDEPASLSLEKSVSQVGANTTFAPADWTLMATPQFSGSQGTVSEPGDDGVLDEQIFAGTYQLSESGPTGFTAGVGTVRSWTLAADATESGGSTISGLSGDAAIDHANVATGTYLLSEADGPEGYESAGWTCENATIAGLVPFESVTEGSVALMLGDDVTCTITNIAQSPIYNDSKTSDPVTGSVVQPGQTITYRIDLTHTGGVVPLNRIVTDDMSGVLNHATFVEGSIAASQGEAVLEGTTLTWNTGSFADTVFLTYQVVVNADAFGQTLTNLITPVTGGECDGQCSTTHYVAAIDMLIEKSHSTANEDNAVVSGKDDLINYRLDVSNQGETAGKDDATGVTVRDTMAFALTLDSAGLAALNPSGDWDFSESSASELIAHYVGNGGVFVAGTSSTILYVATVGTLVPPGGNMPTSEIDNEGCVAAEQGEANLANNCSPDVTIAKWVLIDPTPFCRANTPFVSYSIPLSNGATPPFVALIWWTPEAFAARTIGIDPADTAAILADGASQIDAVPIPAGWQNGDVLTGEQLWPGAAVDASGNPIAWPGWVQQPNGQWVLEPGAPFYNIRENAIIEVRTTSAGEAFVQATLSIPGCDPQGYNTTLTALTYTGLTTATWLMSGAFLVGVGVITVWTHRRIRWTGLKKKA